MNIGEFRDRVLKLEFTDGLEWRDSGCIWTIAEKDKKASLYSKFGQGGLGVTFKMRKCGITPSNAILWRGQHCLITDIRELEHMYYQVSAAITVQKACELTRVSSVIGKDGMPKTHMAPPIVFPGCLSEKYMAYRELTPMDASEHLLILIVPKKIKMQAGDLLRIDGERYAVQLCHELGEYQNEYEIIRKRES
ncbi:MAG: hypothetical protein RR209_02570 [Angelakisella sp.]